MPIVLKPFVVWPANSIIETKHVNATCVTYMGLRLFYLKAFLRKNAGSFPVYPGAAEEVWSSWGWSGHPTAFFNYARAIEFLLLDHWNYFHAGGD